jgi:ring-1,2-phenylacetyl-CoA epoxidase subunit PaaD
MSDEITRHQPVQHILNEQEIWEALQEVPDPELPAISVVDMGIVHHIDIDATQRHISLEIMPTFAGCPALSQIQESIKQRLAPLADRIEVTITMNQPWTSDRLSPDARQKLRSVGIAPPAHIGRGHTLPMFTGQPLTCPYCGSQQTVLENVFGPTPCRAIAYCKHCHQPFEQFKPI